EDIDIVLSSPYKRAVQTVEEIASYLDTDVTLIDDFKERILSAFPTKDLNNTIKKVWEDNSFSWEGGESNIAAQKRG
ncbi:histidine phosphatase family protein, partial [Pseudomonas sp. 2822-15]|uniref:histidine phosphatase family protein n=1 Tax=Pseudomonas sp. 2822-15 TaxID=1712677 RepID=UPI00117A810B